MPTIVVVSCYPFDDTAQTELLADSLEGVAALLAIDPNPRSGMMTDSAEFVRGFEALAARSALVKVGEDDATLLYGEPLDALRARLIDLGVDAVLATQGSAGATIEAGEIVVTRPISDLPGRIVDTMGAGDAAFAAAVAALLDGLPADEDAWSAALENGDGCRGRDVPLRGSTAAAPRVARRHRSGPHRDLSRPRCGGRIDVGGVDFRGTRQTRKMGDRASARLYKPVGCASGELPKRPKGSDCKSAGVAFGGSNPSLATKRIERPLVGRFLRFTRPPPLAPAPSAGKPTAPSGSSRLASVRLLDRTDERSTTMTDTQGNIDDATKAARDAADKVRVATARARNRSEPPQSRSLTISRRTRTQAKSAASSTVNDIADKVTDKVGDVARWREERGIRRRRFGRQGRGCRSRRREGRRCQDQGRHGRRRFRRDRHADPHDRGRTDREGQAGLPRATRRRDRCGSRRCGAGRRGPPQPRSTLTRRPRRR